MGWGWVSETAGLRGGRKQGASELGDPDAGAGAGQGSWWGAVIERRRLHPNSFPPRLLWAEGLNPGGGVSSVEFGKL